CRPLEITDHVAVANAVRNNAVGGIIAVKARELAIANSFGPQTCSNRIVLGNKETWLRPVVDSSSEVSIDYPATDETVAGRICGNIQLRFARVSSFVSAGFLPCPKNVPIRITFYQSNRRFVKPSR